LLLLVVPLLMLLLLSSLLLSWHGTLLGSHGNADCQTQSLSPTLRCCCGCSPLQLGSAVDLSRREEQKQAKRMLLLLRAALGELSRGRR
jgi:hypothetical protein